jgi:hypothetical protein
MKGKMEDLAEQTAKRIARDRGGAHSPNVEAFLYAEQCGDEASTGSIGPDACLGVLEVISASLGNFPERPPGIGRQSPPPRIEGRATFERRRRKKFL